METYRITRKQNNSRYCLLCGTENPLSMKAKFYEIETGELVCISHPLEEHQSYPERIHGGMLSVILDETIGRSMNIDEPENWGVTAELNIKYKKPVPMNEPIIAVAKLTRNSRKIFEGIGQILLSNGDVAVEAWGKYMKVPIETICAGFELETEWVYVPEENMEIIQFNRNEQLSMK